MPTQARSQHPLKVGDLVVHRVFVDSGRIAEVYDHKYGDRYSYRVRRDEPAKHSEFFHVSADECVLFSDYLLHEAREDVERALWGIERAQEDVDNAMERWCASLEILDKSLKELARVELKAND